MNILIEYFNYIKYNFSFYSIFMTHDTLFIECVEFEI